MSIKSHKKIKLFEAFAGIGSQYKALKNIANEKGWEIESIGIIEWFVPAIIAYQAIHYPNYNILDNLNIHFPLDISLSLDSKKECSTNWKSKNYNNSEISVFLKASRVIAKNHFDIKSLNGNAIENDIDIFTYSFPCQDISNQGKQKGFSKDSNTRSSLLWEIQRIFNEMLESKKKLPKYLLLENVKALINKNNMSGFQNWIDELNNLGYETKYYLLNSSNFGSSQNRERVFAISIRKDHKLKVKFEFPKLNNYIKQKNRIKDILDLNNTFISTFDKYKKEPSLVTKNNIKKYKLTNYTSFQSESFVYDVNYTGPTLTASGAMSRIKLLFDNNKIRLMNSKECFKYMDFQENDYYLVKNTNLVNDNKMIYLCGNSISVKVLEEIFRNFKF